MIKNFDDWLNENTPNELSRFRKTKDPNKLEENDCIEIDGKIYAIQDFNHATRSVSKMHGLVAHNKIVEVTVWNKQPNGFYDWDKEPIVIDLRKKIFKKVENPQIVEFRKRTDKFFGIVKADPLLILTGHPPEPSEHPGTDHKSGNSVFIFKKRDGSDFFFQATCTNFSLAQDMEKKGTDPVLKGEEITPDIIQKFLDITGSIFKNNQRAFDIIMKAKTVEDITNNPEIQQFARDRRAEVTSSKLRL